MWHKDAITNNFFITFSADSLIYYTSTGSQKPQQSVNVIGELESLD